VRVWDIGVSREDWIKCLWLDGLSTGGVDGVGREKVG